MLSVHIPPHHTPALQGNTLAQPLSGSPESRYSSSFAPIMTQGTFSKHQEQEDCGVRWSGASSRSRQGSLAISQSSSSQSLGIEGPIADLVTLPKAMLPPSRDFKKFARKWNGLERVEWLGRGGAGIWTINRTAGGSKESKILFVPITERTKSNDEAEEADDLLRAIWEQEARKGIAPALVSPTFERKRSRDTTCSSYTSLVSLTSANAWSTSSSESTAPESPMQTFAYSATAGVIQEVGEFPELSTIPLALSYPIRNRPSADDRGISTCMSVVSSSGVPIEPSASIDTSSVTAQSHLSDKASPVRKKIAKAESISGGTGISTIDGGKNIVKIVHGGGYVQKFIPVW